MAQVPMDSDAGPHRGLPVGTAAMAAVGRPARRWPRGHWASTFSGPPEFEGLVTGFAAEGRARRERVVISCDEPRRNQWPAELLDRGDLQLLGTTELCGPDLVVHPEGRDAILAVLVAEARAAGYAGLRVAGDNSSLLATPERAAAWRRWEAGAGEFLSRHGVTALCAFDVRRVPPSELSAVLALHEPAQVR